MNNLVRTTRFWNNFNHRYLKVKWIGKPNNLNVFESKTIHCEPKKSKYDAQSQKIGKSNSKVSKVNSIAKIGQFYLCLMETNFIIYIYCLSNCCEMCKLKLKEWVSDCFLTQLSSFPAISWREQVTFQWDDMSAFYLSIYRYTSVSWQYFKCIS